VQPRRFFILQTNHSEIIQMSSNRSYNFDSPLSRKEVNFFDSPNRSSTRATPACGQNSQYLARQEDIDHRESQLNARMAQFETLVRNTKLSLQTKVDEVEKRQQEIAVLEERLQLRQISQEDWVHNEKRVIENERLEVQARRAEVEERLCIRERELQDIAAQREAEIVAQVEEYREQLEAKLAESKADYQRRFESKCKEIETEFLQRLAEEKNAYENLQRKLESEYRMRIDRIDSEVAARKDEIESNFSQRYDDLHRQYDERKRELEDIFQRRFEQLGSEYVQKQAEQENRFRRIEDQLIHREMLIKEAEEDWSHRSGLFESQWKEFEQLRKTRTEELNRREIKIEERNHVLIELEAQMKKQEVEQAAFDESLKLREHQVSLDEQKYKELQQFETRVNEANAEAGRIREALMRERVQMQKANEGERRRLRETQEIALKRLNDERQEIAGQNKRLEQLRLAMERSREELGRMLRETLEIRLATEELWLRLSGESSSEDLKKSVTEIRSRLSRQYQELSMRIEGQKHELKQSRDEMLQQYETMLKRREELDRWAAETEKALDEREKTAAEREAEISRRETKLDDAQRRIREERTEMEKEVHLLREQMDSAFSSVNGTNLKRAA